MQRILVQALIVVASLAAGAATPAQTPIYFHAIHCDPQFASEQDWDALVALVAAADARGLPLTLQFNPAWATTISSDPSRASEIEGWVAAGHEVGGHHHVFTHPGGWDGYSNQSVAASAPAYLGDMQAWLAALEAALPSSVEILTVSSKDYDFPAGVDFQTGGSDSTPDPFDAASQPSLKNLQGNDVWNLKHAALIAGGSWQTTAMKASFNATGSDQVFGVAFHPQDYYEGNRSNVDDWFDFLVSADPGLTRSRTAGAILVAHRDSLPTAVPSGSTASFLLLAFTLFALAYPFNGRSPSPNRDNL